MTYMLKDVMHTKYIVRELSGHLRKFFDDLKEDYEKKGIKHTVDLKDIHFNNRSDAYYVTHTYSDCIYFINTGTSDFNKYVSEVLTFNNNLVPESEVNNRVAIPPRQTLDEALKFIKGFDASKEYYLLPLTELQGNSPVECCLIAIIILCSNRCPEFKLDYDNLKSNFFNVFYSLSKGHIGNRDAYYVLYENEVHLIKKNGENSFGESTFYLPGVGPVTQSVLLSQGRIGIPSEFGSKPVKGDEYLEPLLSMALDKLQLEIQKKNKKVKKLIDRINLMKGT